MGQFQDSLETQSSSLWEGVCKSLRLKQDGSYEEFIDALNNKDIGATMIQVALRKTLGFEIGETTIRRWRHKLKINEI